MSKQDGKWNRICARRTLSERDVYELIGRLFFGLHAFEKIMYVSFLLLHATFAQPDDESDVGKFVWKMRKKACGQLAFELRKLMVIDPAFDRLLVRLIRRRNQLIHKLTLRKEFNPERNANWHQNVARFIFRFEADVNAASDVFERYAETLIDQVDRDPRAAILKSNIRALKLLQPRWTGEEN